MDFLQITRPKFLRTSLYGDQQFSRFELEILHTPVVQRLYNLKQLGFTDRVFPDAVHARFNHILGVIEVVDVMRRRLIAWLKAHEQEEFSFYVLDGEAGKEQGITAADLALQLDANEAPLRLMGMLHDLTHAAFGHTLEDEVNVFQEKHDDPRRQKRFFNGLVGQLLYLWCTEEQLHLFDASVIEELSDLNLSVNHARELRWAQELSAILQDSDRQNLASHLRDLEFAFKLLLHLDVLHTHDGKPAEVPPSLLDGLLVTSVINVINPQSPERAFVLHRDMFMVDLVGNTICADLLDYARRDAHNAGLRIQFDDRFLRYLCVASVRDGLSPTTEPCIRTAIQIFTNKMRHDVLSEMSGILKARYLINERVLFHPTKCAAGAMLGTAVQLLGLKDLPAWMQVLGDQEFLRVLIVMARNLQNVVPLIDANSEDSASESWSEVVTRSWAADDRMATILNESIRSILGETNNRKLSVEQLSALLERSQSARKVLWQLKSRRFPKLAYRLGTAHHTSGASDETIAETYSRPSDRYQLERTIEQTCDLPMGTVFIHCPRRKTSMKVAEVLVVGGDVSKAAQLKDLTLVSPEGLQPYEDEIKAVQNMYRSIWQFHAYLDVAYWEKQPLVSWALERELTFRNDELLSAELSHETQGPYAVLINELKDEFAPIHVTTIVNRIGAEVRARGHSDSDLQERLRSIIRQVNAEQGGTPKTQMNLPGVEGEL
jgi:HD superfamily phosphohydrolase